MKRPIDGRVSLVISITGHRDLERDDYRDLEKEVGKILEKLQAKYPNTPLLLLSGLAEGADRIAVYAAQRLRNPVPYVAVLPLPAAIYREDFAKQSSNDEFDELLKNADQCIELPLDEQFEPGEIEKAGQARDAHYANLGRYLVQYSQLLIAIWDGNRLAKTGGTSHVVAMKLREEPPTDFRESGWMNWNGSGPVYVLPARRVHSKQSMPPALKIEVRCPEGSTWEDYDASYKLLDLFNREPTKPGWNLSEKIKRSRTYLFEGAEAIGLTDRMEWVATVYAKADALAIRYANYSLWLWRLVFVLAAASGIALAVHEGGDSGTGIFLAAYGGCFLCALVLMALEPIARLRRRHEDYRALAEALRVQFFWMAAGIPDIAAEQYLPKQYGEMAWIRDAISECVLCTPARHGNHPLRLRLAHQWVKGQASYFSRTFRRHGLKEKRLAAFAYAASAIGILAPFASLAGYEFARAGWMGPSAAPCEPSVSHMAAAIGLWCGALAWHYIERRGFKQEARQYARMYELFHEADRVLESLERAKDWRASEDTIRALGREALEESGEWLSMHRERKLRLDDVTG